MPTDPGPTDRSGPGSPTPTPEAPTVTPPPEDGRRVAPAPPGRHRRRGEVARAPDPGATGPRPMGRARSAGSMPARGATSPRTRSPDARSRQTGRTSPRSRRPSRTPAGRPVPRVPSARAQRLVMPAPDPVPGQIGARRAPVAAPTHAPDPGGRTGQVPWLGRPAASIGRSPSPRARSWSPAAARSKRRSSPAARRTGCSSCRNAAMALEQLVLHATSLRIPVVEVEGGTADGAGRLRWAPGDRARGGTAPLGRRPTTSSPLAAAARGAAAGPRPRLARGPPERRARCCGRAEATGVHGALFPTRHQAPLTPAAVKASAGAVEHLLLAPVDDLAGALADLHARGLRIVGADGDAPLTARQADLRGPLAIVVGSEGRGLGPAVRRRCDLLVRIPMHGRIESLNAAVAGSILLYEAAAQPRRERRVPAPAGPDEERRRECATRDDGGAREPPTQADGARRPRARRRPRGRGGTSRWSAGDGPQTAWRAGSRRARRRDLGTAQADAAPDVDAIPLPRRKARAAGRRPPRPDGVDSPGADAVSAAGARARRAR